MSPKNQKWLRIAAAYLIRSETFEKNIDQEYSPKEM